MKRPLCCIFLAVVLATLATADERRAQGRADHTGGELSVAAPFPTIARDQSRPRQYTAHLVDDPGEASGDYVAGQCNCKRDCPELNKYQCKLTGDPFNQCQMTNGTCSDCTKDCGA